METGQKPPVKFDCFSKGEPGSVDQFLRVRLSAPISDSDNFLGATEMRLMDAFDSVMANLLTFSFYPTAMVFHSTANLNERALTIVFVPTAKHDPYMLSDILQGLKDGIEVD